MSFAASVALQSAVYQCLSSDQNLRDCVGDAVFDAPPEGRVPALFVMIGVEDVRTKRDHSGDTALHKITVEVRSEQHGFLQAKKVAACVDDALSPEAISLSNGELVSLTFQRASARRGRNGMGRGVDLQYRAIVDHADINGDE